MQRRQEEEEGEEKEMTGKTHAICGTMTAVAVAVCNAKGIQFGDYMLIPWISVIAAPTGSYMPDIDLHRSKMGSKHKIISKMLTHRGITHTLLVPVILAVLQWFLMDKGVIVLPDLIFGFNIGWVVHIIADMFNKKGVPLLWPLTNAHLHVATILTSTWQEGLFIAFWAVVNLGACWYIFTH